MLEQVKKILNIKKDEATMGPGKTETTLTNEDENEKLERIRKHIADVNNILKEKFGYVYGQEKPNLEGEEKEEFDILVKEIEDSKSEIEKTIE